jgi:P4 family phage/plasmid primase-like protien
MPKYDSETETKKQESFRYERLALAYIEDTSTVHHQGQFYTYTGTHYAREEYLECKVRRWFYSQRIEANNNLVNSVVPAIKAFALVGSAKLPCWKDGVPQRQVVPFLNGLLDLDAYLSRGEVALLPHTPNYRCGYCLPFSFDPAASCPRWESFLGSALGDDQAALLAEWFGYVVSGDTGQQKFALCVGPPQAGKGTVAEVLSDLIGRANSTGFDLRSLVSRFGPSSLVGRSLAVVGEVELSGVRERSAILEKLKSITGEDQVSVEYKGEKHFPSVVLPTRFHVLSNTMPSFADPSAAIGRRMLIFRFDHSVPEAERDVELKSKLRAELPGIAVWALAGLRRLRGRGRFGTTDRMEGELSKVRRTSSPVRAFLSDCCRVHRTLDTGSLDGIETADGPVEAVWVSRETFQAKARAWAAENDIEIKPYWFARDLHELLPRLPERHRRRDEAGRQFYDYPGVALK